jgi:hypothetical protein
MKVQVIISASKLPPKLLKTHEFPSFRQLGSPGMLRLVVTLRVILFFRRNQTVFKRKTPVSVTLKFITMFILGFCTNSTSCKVPWWRHTLEVETSCQIMNIRKGVICVSLKKSLHIWNQIIWTFSLKRNQISASANLLGPILREDWVTNIWTLSRKLRFLRL